MKFKVNGVLPACVLSQALFPDNAYRQIIPRLLLSCFLFATSLASWAGTFTVFGPETFVRGSGQPTTVVRNFSVAQSGSSYILKIQNGGLADDQYELVSSSVITPQRR